MSERCGDCGEPLAFCTCEDPDVCTICGEGGCEGECIRQEDVSELNFDDQGG